MKDMPTENTEEEEATVAIFGYTFIPCAMGYKKKQT